MIVLLDSAPLGIISNPKSSSENEACRTWLTGLLLRHVDVVVPEIADYEVRRELPRAEKFRGIARLDALKTTLSYLPLSTPVMVAAAEFWASARKQGRQSADDAALDADMILAAQEALLIANGEDTVVATSNLRHLRLFAPAKLWQEI